MKHDFSFLFNNLPSLFSSSATAASSQPKTALSFIPWCLTWLFCEISRMSQWFCMSSPRLWADLSPSLSLTAPFILPSVPSLLPHPSLLSSQWLHLVLAFSPLRGFLCSLGYQVKAGMSGLLNTERGWGGGLRFAHWGNHKVENW